MTKTNLYCIGVMTGNSLDAVDVVITRFDNDQMADICGHSLPIPVDIADGFRELKQKLKANSGNINQIYQADQATFLKLHDAYIKIVAKTVNQAIKKANLQATDIDLIGFHGQTCAHFPPSIAKDAPHTLQIGSGQMLANLTGIKVAYDFRSDDLMNGGEAAPLAPVHNLHIATDLKTKGIFPVVFCNGGNTGNMSVISANKTGQIKVFGWDTGPFNHFIDYLTRSEKNEPCDYNGKYGLQGTINQDLLRQMFNQAVLTENGDNFLLKNPPKSSDPAWYKILPSMTDQTIPFNDRIRTAEYFSAYIFVYNLKYLASELDKPHYFLTFGGGWHNPVVLKDFKNLLTGKAHILPEHQEIFSQLQIPNAIIAPSDQYGYNGQFMEARIFADMAKCLLTQKPFSYPDTTGCKTPTIGGIIATPGGNDPRLWSRAALGWQT